MDGVLFWVCLSVQVIVDMREFRSSLPSLLHKKGVAVVPLTLEVSYCPDTLYLTDLSLGGGLCPHTRCVCREKECE